MKIAPTVLYFLLHSRKITSSKIIIYKILKLYNKINFLKINKYKYIYIKNDSSPIPFLKEKIHIPLRVI